MRVASGGKGKRGGPRVIDYWYVAPDAFARMLGVSPGTVRKLERGTIEPSGAARTLLKIAAKYPAIVQEAANS